MKGLVFIPNRLFGMHLQGYNNLSLISRVFDKHLSKGTAKPVKYMSHSITKPIKALQALHDSPPLCLFLLLHMFWNKKYQCDQINQLFNKIFSINIILKSIKGHNSVEKFRKIMCISHNMDHIYQCINKILSKSIHYF